MRLVSLGVALALLVGCANDYGHFRIARASGSTTAPLDTNEADSGAADAAPDAK